MEEHSIFYYPYSYFTDNDLPFLKAAALYFDKLYTLDPLKASFATIGVSSEINEAIILLEQANILERIEPTEVLSQDKYRNALKEEILRDIKDEEFNKICQSKSSKPYWTLALSKIPRELRNDAAFKPLDEAMKDILTPANNIYDETRYMESRYTEVYSREIEYRYIDVALNVGESIMINHALFSGLLYSKATPITDDDFHRDIFEYKIKRAVEDPTLKELITPEAFKNIKPSQVAQKVLIDVDLAIISPTLPIEAILEYRLDNEEKLEEVREKLFWLSRTIREEPHTKEFYKEIEHQIIPREVQPLLKECKTKQKQWLKKNKKKWLEVTGISVGTASTVIPLVFSVIPYVTIPLAVVAIALRGRKLISKWKSDHADNVNDLSYFFNLKKIEHQTIL